jgi:hypothetical protein
MTFLRNRKFTNIFSFISNKTIRLVQRRDLYQTLSEKIQFFISSDLRPINEMRRQRHSINLILMVLSKVSILSHRSKQLLFYCMWTNYKRGHRMAKTMIKTIFIAHYFIRNNSVLHIDSLFIMFLYSIYI